MFVFKRIAFGRFGCTGHDGMYAGDRMTLV